MVLALPELLALAGLIFALGMVVMGQKFTEALFQVTESGLGWIPWIGRKAANGVHVVGKRIDSAFSAAALRLEGAVTATWHVSAFIVEQAGAALWDVSKVGARALWYVEVKYPLWALDALARKGIADTKYVTKTIRPTIQNFATYKGISAAQWKATLRRIGVLSARVAALPALGAGALVLPFPRIGALERRVRTWGSRLTRLEARFGKKAFAAAVGTALGALGLSWIRRSCVKRNAERLCRVDPGILEDLLGGLVGIVGTLSIVTFAEAALDAQEEVMPLIKAGVRELNGI